MQREVALVLKDFAAIHRVGSLDDIRLRDRKVRTPVAREVHSHRTVLLDPHEHALQDLRPIRCARRGLPIGRHLDDVRPSTARNRIYSQP